MVRVVGVDLLVCGRARGDRQSRRATRTKLVAEHYDGPLNTFGHSSTDAHSMQCSGSRGVLAIVQMGNAVGGVCMCS